MSTCDLLIKNGNIATASDFYKADIAVNNGKIFQIGNINCNAKKTIDAEDNIITPGGVDGHCHLDQPTNDNSVFADDFQTGSISAAFGGTTTIIPFALQKKGGSIKVAIDEYHVKACGNSIVDYAFHMILTDPSEIILNKELPDLIKSGYTHFKIYMTYEELKLNDLEILKVLYTARTYGAMVMIHAENDECITWLTKLLLESGKIAPKYHAVSRPIIMEDEATHSAISMSELIDVPILIVHVSSERAMIQIQNAQSRGLNIYAETCPQYLFLTANDLESEGFEGAKYICSPPPRTLKDQEKIWLGIKTGVFQVFSSDHAPFRFDDDQGKQVEGSKTKFCNVPNGLPGIETRMPLLMSKGVLENKIDIQTFVSLTSTAPAKIYGLFPRKGTIAPGSDGDLVIWDTKKNFTLSNSMLHHNVDYTPYEGMKFKAWPKTVLSRGKLIIDNGVLTAKKDHGIFLKSDLPLPAKTFDKRSLLERIENKVF
jgi:dihydropyrimidinase